MKNYLFLKNMKKAFVIITGCLLLLAFTQCQKNKEDDENFELACDASDYIDENIQSQLDLLNDKTIPDAMTALAEWIKGQEGVKSAVASDNQVEIVYVDGTKGVVMVYDQTIESDHNFGRGAEKTVCNKQTGNMVGSQTGFIYDAFPLLDNDYFPGDNTQRLFEEHDFGYAHPKEEDCTIDTLKTMFQYGYVQFVTHGGQVVSKTGERMDVFATGEKATRKKRKSYRESMDNDLLVEGRLVIRTGLFGFKYKGRFFGVTNKFIEGLQGQFDNAIVFMGACNGFNENAPLLADAFLRHGGATYLGFNNKVDADFICLTTESILLDLFHGVKIGIAYDNVCSNINIDHCHEYIDEDSGETLLTCLEMAGRLDIVWYENPDAPTVTTHEVPFSNIGSTTAKVTGSVVFPNQLPVEYERGFIYYTMPDGSDAHQLVYSGTELLNFSCTLTGLSSSTSYFVMAYSCWENNQVIIGNTETFKTLNGSGPDPGIHEYVDLGLPSGLLWATCNVGANSPEEYGNYFAWGETQPKDYYIWDTYQYCNGSNASYNTLTKYCNYSDYGYNGFTDGLTILMPEDDAATANWGNGWRMPTEEDFEELYNNTTVTWTQQNDVNGRLFTANNGNSLFLPAAGYRTMSSLYDVGNRGFYWSSSLDTDDPNFAWSYNFHSYHSYMHDDYRNVGFTLRPLRSSYQN